MTQRPTAAAPVFPYDHPTMAVVWARAAAATARTEMTRHAPDGDRRK